MVSLSGCFRKANTCKEVNEGPVKDHKVRQRNIQREILLAPFP